MGVGIAGEDELSGAIQSGMVCPAVVEVLEGGGGALVLARYLYLEIDNEFPRCLMISDQFIKKLSLRELLDDLGQQKQQLMCCILGLHFLCHSLGNSHFPKLRQISNRIAFIIDCKFDVESCALDIRLFASQSEFVAYVVVVFLNEEMQYFHGGEELVPEKMQFLGDIVEQFDRAVGVVDPLLQDELAEVGQGGCYSFITLHLFKYYGV